MKKRAIAVLLGLLLVSAAASAKDIAIGAEATSRGFNSWGGRFVFHLPRIPLYWAVGATSSAGTLAIDMTMDYWLAHGHFASILDYYIGLGLYGAIATGGQVDFALGARLPIGLQIWPLKGNVLEIFLEVAPAWIPLSSAGLDPAVFELQPAIGFRIWF